METFEIHYEQFSVNAPYRIDTELSKLFVTPKLTTPTKNQAK